MVIDPHNPNSGKTSDKSKNLRQLATQIMKKSFIGYRRIIVRYMYIQYKQRDRYSEDAIAKRFNTTCIFAFFHIFALCRNFLLIVQLHTLSALYWYCQASACLCRSAYLLERVYHKTYPVQADACATQGVCHRRTPAYKHTRLLLCCHYQ